MSLALVHVVLDDVPPSAVATPTILLLSAWAYAIADPNAGLLAGTAGITESGVA